jgi:hypothetical protein
MKTDCIAEGFAFQGLGRRQVVGKFDGGTLSTDGGLLLLRELEQRRGILGRFAECFTDYRSPLFVEHSVHELVSQRVLALAAAYEDLNDHDQLNRDPLLATAVGKTDPTGQDRRLPEDRGKPLAASATLNRLEWSPEEVSEIDRYRKITVDSDAVERSFVETFIRSFSSPPARLTLDLDATDDPLHGQQEGRFFHGYYRCYCYLPLYIFCGTHLLCARLREASKDAAHGARADVEKIVAQLREAWPEVQILLRADSGFAREELMSWCEANGVEFVFGLARNARLEAALSSEMETVTRRHRRTRRAERVYKDFSYRTQKSWSRQRRVIGKAEVLRKGANPRFIVTSLSRAQIRARDLYERIYCARGEMENRIKEQQLYLFADRTSAHTMRVNQMRLWFASLAYTMLNELRRLGLSGTSMAHARCDTLRLKLIKIAARVRVSVRRVAVSFASSYPHQALFSRVYERLTRAGPAIA